MIETCLLNSGSFLLGVTAWTLPIIQLVRRYSAGTERKAVLPAISVVACAASLFLQILEFNHRVGQSDWSALMDTSQTVALAAALLLAGTIVLNAAALAGHFSNGRTDG
jgi:cytochrome c oxidase subunit 4